MATIHHARFFCPSCDAGISRIYWNIDINSLNDEIMEQQPGLYGLKNCNRDFTKQSNWGKNIFNNCFPVGLARYVDDAGYDLIYIVLGQRPPAEAGGLRETVSPG